MRHRKKGKILSRKRGARLALIRNLANSLILHEKIITTEAKAKVLRPFVERMVTKASAHGGALTDRRAVIADLHSREVAEKLISDIAPRYKERRGGCLRITKLSTRAGDGAGTAQIEFVT